MDAAESYRCQKQKERKRKLKKMKKILAFVLAMAMVLGMSVTAFADEDDVDPGMMTDSVIGNSNDTGTIEVKGITPEAGISVKAYQIIKATYDDTNDTFSGYAAIYPDVKPAIDVTTGDNALVTIGEAQLSAIVSHIMTTKKLNCSEEHEHGDSCYTVVNNVATGTVYDMNLDNDGVATAENLPVGSYLVLISGAETKVYNPAVVSIYYDVVDGTENILDGGKLDIVSTENVWVKVSDTPTVDKVMAGEEGNEKGNSVNIGDDVEYAIPISPIPNYGGEHPVLNIVDTLSVGLTYNKDLKVYVYNSNISTNADGLTDATVEEKELTENVDYTVEESTKDGKTTITVDFVVDGYATAENGAVNDYTLNDYVGSAVVVRYSARLNDKAAINEKDNENSVTLNYTKDSKIDSDDVTGEDEKKTYTYTFDIDGAAEGEGEVENRLTEGILNKTGEETKKDIVLGTETIKDVLKDAEFTLYTVNPDDFTPKDGKDKIENYIYKNGNEGIKGFNGVVTSNERGQLPIKGLAAGTYYLKETKAPAGYSLNTHVFKIVIDAQYYKEGDTLPEGFEYGQLKDWTIKIDDTTTNAFTVTHEGGKKVVYTNATNNSDTITGGNISPVVVPNTKLSSLPSTGGIGTTIFTIGGCAIMIIAAGLFFASRRKSSK